jgi:hypothetical protein
MNLTDIGQLVHARREVLGLSQARLARLGEAPLSLIVAGLAEVVERTHTSPKTLWKHLAAWA